MDPNDRLETVAKTKLAAKREQAVAGDEPAEGARYRVPQADADRITDDETLHKFPAPHTDYITQTISYQIPVEKLADLARFDGSLIVYRTAGQVSATCDNEAATLLTMNLMHEIVQAPGPPRKPARSSANRRRPG